jgi:hypothetical protein
LKCQQLEKKALEESQALAIAWDHSKDAFARET